MNAAYRLVNSRKGIAVASENAKGHRSVGGADRGSVATVSIFGKCGKLRVLLASLLLACASPAFALPALPSGGSFFGNASGSISTSGSTETVNITANNANNVGGVSHAALIDWSGGFDVASGDTVDFTANAGLNTNVINVDDSGNASDIAGTITQGTGVDSVTVINPDGMTVDDTAVIPSTFTGISGNVDTTAGSGPAGSGYGVELTDAPISSSITSSGVTSLGGYAAPDFTMTASGQSVEAPLIFGTTTEDVAASSSGQSVIVDMPYEPNYANGGTGYVYDTDLNVSGFSSATVDNTTYGNGYNNLDFLGTSADNAGISESTDASVNYTNIVYAADSPDAVTINNKTAGPTDVLLDGVSRGTSGGVAFTVDSGTSNAGSSTVTLEGNDAYDAVTNTPSGGYPASGQTGGTVVVDGNVDISGITTNNLDFDGTASSLNFGTYAAGLNLYNTPQGALSQNTGTVNINYGSISGSFLKLTPSSSEGDTLDFTGWNLSGSFVLDNNSTAPIGAIENLNSPAAINYEGNWGGTSSGDGLTLSNITAPYSNFTYGLSTPGGTLTLSGNNTFGSLYAYFNAINTGTGTLDVTGGSSSSLAYGLRLTSAGSLTVSNSIVVLGANTGLSVLKSTGGNVTVDSPINSGGSGIQVMSTALDGVPTSTGAVDINDPITGKGGLIQVNSNNVAVDANLVSGGSIRFQGTSGDTSSQLTVGNGYTIQANGSQSYEYGLQMLGYAGITFGNDDTMEGVAGGGYGMDVATTNFTTGTGDTFSYTGDPLSITATNASFGADNTLESAAGTGNSGAVNISGTSTLAFGSGDVIQATGGGSLMNENITGGNVTFGSGVTDNVALDASDMSSGNPVGVSGSSVTLDGNDNLTSTNIATTGALTVDGTGNSLGEFQVGGLNFGSGAALTVNGEYAENMPGATPYNTSTITASGSFSSSVTGTPNITFDNYVNPSTGTDTGTSGLLVTDGTSNDTVNFSGWTLSGSGLASMGVDAANGDTVENLALDAVPLTVSGAGSLTVSGLSDTAGNMQITAGSSTSTSGNTLSVTGNLSGGSVDLVAYGNDNSGNTGTIYGGTVTVGSNVDVTGTSDASGPAITIDTVDGGGNGVVNLDSGSMLTGPSGYVYNAAQTINYQSGSTVNSADELVNNGTTNGTPNLASLSGGGTTIEGSGTSMPSGTSIAIDPGTLNVAGTENAGSPPAPASTTPTSSPVSTSPTTTPTSSPAPTTPVFTSPVSSPASTSPVSSPASTTPVSSPASTTPVSSPAPVSTTPASSPTPASIQAAKAATDVAATEEITAPITPLEVIPAPVQSPEAQGTTIKVPNGQGRKSKQALG